MADKKPKKSDKVSPVQYLGQVRQEGRKVVWPTRQETTTTTILVLIMCVIMGVFFFIVDWFLRVGVDLILNSFGGGA